MFYGASAFNQDISGWDTGMVTTMANMFNGATAFNNGDVALSWGANTGAVSNMLNMFYGASAFNQDISGWDTGTVTTMANMFNGASAFDNGGQQLAWADTSKVTDMGSMFVNAVAFNRDISSWNTGEVTNMANMLNGASAFNNGGQPLAWADTSKVTTMAYMFQGAAAFNQDISSWNAAPTTCGANFASGATAWLAAYPGGSIASNPPLNAAMALICGP